MTRVSGGVIMPGCMVGEMPMVFEDEGAHGDHERAGVASGTH